MITWPEGCSKKRWLGAKASTVFQGMNPGKKDDRFESYFMVGGSQITLRSGGIWLGPSGPLFLRGGCFGGESDDVRHPTHGETCTAGGLRVQVLSAARRAIAVAFLGHGISVVVTGWTLWRVHLPSLRVCRVHQRMWVSQRGSDIAQEAWPCLLLMVVVMVGAGSSTGPSQGEAGGMALS